MSRSSREPVNEGWPKLETAAELVLQERLGQGAATYLRQQYTVNTILERYALGPPEIAAPLLQAVAERLQTGAEDRNKAEEIQGLWTPDLSETPQSLSETESYDASSVFTRTRSSCDSKSGLSDDELADSLKPEVRPGYRRFWPLCFADSGMEDSFHVWILLEWKRKLRHREYLLVFITLALLVSNWPSGPHTRLALLLAILLTIPQKLSCSARFGKFIQLLSACARTLSAVLASMSQWEDMRETRIGAWLLSMQSGIVHVLAVSLIRRPDFASDLLAVIVTVIISILLLPVICTEALLFQLTFMVVVPMMWQYQQEWLARKVFLMDRYPDPPRSERARSGSVRSDRLRSRLLTEAPS